MLFKIQRSNITRRLRGFTLVELLVVISIIGILTAIITVSLSAARANARDKARVADVANIEQAIRLYAEENGQYPLYPEGVTVGTGGAIDTDLAPYFTTVPVDPRSGDGGFNYYYDSSYTCGGTEYVIVMALDSESDSITNYAEICGGGAIGDQNSHLAHTRVRDMFIPVAEAYMQSSYYSQGYYQSAYYSQSSYYSQSTYYSEGTYYTQGYYQSYYQGAYGGGDTTPGDRPYIVLVN